jgi:hypothetical protein
MVETVDEPLEGLSTISEPDEEALTQQLPDEIPELAAFIKERFFEAEQGRRGDESRWLRAYNDFRGRYDAGVHFRENERSRVFVKIPKTKTLAAYGQLVEVIFAGNKFPIGIRPTEKPTGVAEKAHFDPNGKGEPEEELAPELQVGFPGDGHKSAKDSILGGLAAIFPAGKFSPGRSLDPKKPQVNPADEAAREMETHIHDQLTETHAAREMRSALFQSALYGTRCPNENMADSTMLMNGHARMAIDNLALSGNLIFDIDESALVPGQPTDIYPGKIFRRQSGAPGQAIHGIKFPSTTTENLAMFDKWRQIADEETGIPSYSHGQTRVQSTTRTAAGMSMLMGAAALNIKTVVKNIDDYHLKPIGEGFYYWNMQFNPDVRIQGDLRVKALGTDALMQKEVRSQRIQQFLQASANPYMAPFVKFHTLIKELAITLDLDPEDITNNPEEAMIAAQIFGATGAMGEGQGEPGADQGPTGTGGGTIGVGGAPQPGDPTFSGTPGGNGGEPQP